MRQIATIFLVLFATTLFGQNNIQTDNKSNFLLVVYQYQTSLPTKCYWKAIKIMGDTVLIDTCYNQKEKIFTASKKETISNSSLYSKISNLTNLEWQKMQQDIDNIQTCDFTAAFEITLKEKDKVEFYSLKPISHCYPESAKDVMESLENYFDKMH